MARTDHPSAACSGLEDAPRWRAVLNRDAASDGTFVFAVVTTGIYCRPSCPARRARPENVRFFDAPPAAERAGFRPCRRCRPADAASGGGRDARVVAACRALEAAETVPTLAALARDAGLSPFHFHRVFRSATGVTPRAFAAAHRAKRLRAALSENAASITDAGYAAGFGSSGRLYAATDAALGMTPTAYRAGGAQQTIRVAVTACALGPILVAGTDRGLCAVTLGDDADQLRAELRARFPHAEFVDGDAAFERWVSAVVDRVETPGRPHGALPLDIAGTAFQRSVWEALRTIPIGRTASYAAIARAIGQPRAVRAVAQACASNPVAIAVPCHRVVRSDGALSGYRWGTERKRKLLEREAAGTPADDLAPVEGSDGKGRSVRP